MRIIISKELDNFTLRGGYTEIESESNDGMRRGSAYHVETTTEFILRIFLRPHSPLSDGLEISGGVG